MKKMKKLVDITSTGRRFKEAAAIFADANARISWPLLHARNLSEFIDLINLETSEVLANATDASTEWAVL